jgi:hypothetical protein
MLLIQESMQRAELFNSTIRTVPFIHLFIICIHITNELSWCSEGNAKLRFAGNASGIWRTLLPLSDSHDMAFLYYPIFLTPAHPTNLQIVAEQSVSKLIGNIWMVDRNLCKE